jgi:hypothetical protein
MAFALDLTGGRFATFRFADYGTRGDWVWLN